LGSEQGIYLCGSFPPDKQSNFANRHNQNRVIQDGDVFHLLVENNGAGGFFTELGRTIVLGKASARQKEEFEFTLQAQKFTLDMLKPGTPCRDIWDTYNQFMRENGRPEESRLYCHGQGYDLVERPLARHDEPMTIEKNMNIVCHPTYVLDGIHSWICDNYLIGGNGPGDSLHKTPQQLFEV
jgi:Xaa-Pro aminopeptidase